MKRHAAREKAFQILFHIDMEDFDPEYVAKEHFEIMEMDAFLKELIQGVVKNKTVIDETIANNLEKWSLERIASVEKTILRIATFEIKYMDDIPTNVSINEAVELAKMYGDEKSGKFVNGVLSKIVA